MNHDSDPFRVALEHLKDMIPATGAGPPGAEPDQKSTLPVPPEVEEAARKPQARLDQYVLVSRLGVGGISDVWRAWDRELKRWVAIKFLQLYHPEDFLRLEREAQASAKLIHPNIAAVYGVGKRDGTPYVALQLVEGETLAAYLECAPKLAASLVGVAALAVHHAHEAGVLHRDLKPQNIMVERFGASEDGPFRVTVMDFGLPKETSINRTVPRSVVGTPSYMSPEQAQGQSDRVDARSDVYSLGATLYDLVTGLPPFTGVSAAEILRQVVEHEPAPPRELEAKVGADLEAIILKCLEKDPERRYPTAQALAMDLERVVQGEASQARPPGFGDRLRKRILSHKARSLALGVVAATALGTLSLLTAGSVERGREREAAEMARLATQGSKEAQTLRRTRSSSPAQWEGGFAQALEKADVAVQKFPRFATGHYVRGEVLRAQGRFRDAVRAFDRALAINPALQEAWYGRGICHLELYSETRSAPSLEDLTGRNSALLRTREPQLETEKAAAVADLGRYLLFQQNQTDRALDSRYARGALAYAEGHYERAREAARDLIAQYPKEERFWVLKAQAEDALQDYDAAKETLDRLISDVVPQWAEAHRLRACVLMHLGNWKAAQESAGEAVRLDSRSARSLAVRTASRRKLGDLKGAIEDLGKSIEIDPGDATPYLARGRLSLEGKEPGAALGDFKKALDLSPELRAELAPLVAECERALRNP